MSLKEQLSNSDHQESLEKADVTVMIRKLADIDNPEALNFVIEALRVLALSFSRNGHSSIIIDLLMHGEPKVQEGAAAALEAIANGSAQERKSLVKDDIIGRLIGHDEHLGQMQLRLLSSIIPKLAIDYLDIGKIERIFQLLEYDIQFTGDDISDLMLMNVLVINSSQFVPQQHSAWPSSLVNTRNRKHAREICIRHPFITTLFPCSAKLQHISQKLWRVTLWSMATLPNSSAYCRAKTSINGNQS